MAYLTERDRQWRAYLDERLAEAGAGSGGAAGGGVRRRGRRGPPNGGGKGCGMINAHAEISDPAHPAYAVIIGQKRWMLELFRGVADDAGAGDPATLAVDLMLLHEGTLVTAGMGVINDPFGAGRTAALARLASA